MAIRSSKNGDLNSFQYTNILKKAAISSIDRGNFINGAQFNKLPKLNGYIYNIFPMLFQLSMIVLVHR